MADRYKEGRDFEWVPMKNKDGDIVKDGRGGSVKTRRFFTKAEKDAMKAKDKPKAKPKPKPATTSSRVDTTDDARAARTNSSERYGTGSGPRTAAPKPSSSENASTTPPASASDEDSFPSRVNSAREETQRLLKETAPIDRGVSYEEWEAMTRAERRAAGLPLTKVGWQNQRLTYRSSADTTERNSSTARSDDARARATRTNRSRNSPDIPGMAKGGMVKKGTRDYKKSGMFYKSGSPRGYK
jgi:hypothetical protein